MTEELSEIEVIYMGKRMTTSGKVAHSFITEAQIDAILASPGDFEKKFPAETADRMERASSLFQVDKNKPGSVGSVYKTKGIIVDGKCTSLVPNGLVWVRPAHGWSSWTNGWKVLHDAVELDRRRKTAEKNADNDPGLRNAINTLRDRYRKLPGGYKRSFFLWLQEELETR